MPGPADAYLSLAQRIDPQGAAAAQRTFTPSLGDDARALAVAVLLATAYPAVGRGLVAHPADARGLAASGQRAPRTRDEALARVRALVDERAGGLAERTSAALRQVARVERARIALRELLPRSLGGADVDVTARELAWLGDATIQVALDEARAWAESRMGRAVGEDGAPSAFVVLGMGKLGGLELNAGSDVDLIYFYDTDEGGVVPPGETIPAAGPDAPDLHGYWSRVARRLTQTLEEPTEDGVVWRVDLRLRPEGSAGPLVNSLGAALRYYESFGRLWERAALLRARPSAGDMDLGARLLDELAPFVWRKRIDPTIAQEMASLVTRARAELSEDASRDLKLGPGGIREAEFFAQTLQLVWGGREPAVRARGTLEALAALEKKGYSTTREAEEVADAYLVLRRAEHAVQVASGLQTHLLPRGSELGLVARGLGFADERRFLADLERHRRRVARRFASLRPEGQPESPWAPVLAALDRGEEGGLTEVLARVVVDRALFPASDDGDPEEAVAALGRHLGALARHPDALLGDRTREQYTGVADVLLDALFEAADPFQAALYLRAFFDRVRQPAVYVRLAFSDPAALRRLVASVGASAFVGDALSNHPELGDMILFSRDVPSIAGARSEVLAAARRPPAAHEDPMEALVESLRVQKTRLTLQVALADLGGDLGVREVNQVLSAIADASLEAAARRAVGEEDVPVRGLSVVAMGKLGGAEISYGSDLDVIFVYDPEAAPDPLDAPAYFTRIARRIIRAISTFHAAGPGYELDTRLRPSGNQGLLVTSLEAFARYHGLAVDGSPLPEGRRAAVWERMALVRARAAAGDPELGARAVGLARATAFAEAGVSPDGAQEIARIRARVEREASLERPGVSDVKLGPGGLLDVEFAVELLQVRHGNELEGDALSPETPVALEGLARAGVLRSPHAETFREGWAFLRRLELRLRVARADASHAFDERGPLLEPLARRMGLRDHPSRSAGEELIARLGETRARVRASYEAVLASLA